MKPLIDAMHILCEDLALTAQEDADPSSHDIDYLDLADADSEFGQGEPLYLYVWISAVYGASAGTLTVALCDCADAATWVELVIGLLATDVNLINCIDGKPQGGPGLICKIAIPPQVKRYVSVHFLVAGADVATGTLTAAIGP
ncbi:MAG TPA: hypothetical protein ENH40_02455 [Nitrospirae bacterium]|nr:hypothetical protein [Nitrospirota bacterium]